MSIAAANELTAARVRELLVYDRETGVIRWRKARGCVPAGAVAGSLDGSGHLTIRVDRRLYQAHRLAWLYVTGEWPNGEIDHKDGDGTNNVFDNLRDVDFQTNQQNKRRARSDNALGVLGVCRSRGRYLASLSHNGRHVHIGYFDTPEAAHSAYVATKRQLHQGCTL